MTTASAPHPPDRPALAVSRTGPRLAPRQCGRCRQLFEGDANLNPAAIPEWWLCPPCRTALLRRATPEGSSC